MNTPPKNLKKKKKKNPPPPHPPRVEHRGSCRSSPGRSSQKLRGKGINAGPVSDMIE